MLYDMLYHYWYFVIRNLKINLNWLKWMIKARLYIPVYFLKIKIALCWIISMLGNNNLLTFIK